MEISKKSVIILILASIFGGLAPGFARFAMEQFSPFSIMVLSSLISSTTLLILVGGIKNLYVNKKDVPFLILAMIFWTVNSVLFFYGLQGNNGATATVTSVLYLFSPMIVLIVSVLLKRLRLSVGKITGIILSILGSLVIISQSLAGTTQVLVRSIGGFQGNILILGAVLSISFYWLVSDELTKKRNYSAFLVTTYSNLGILLSATPFFIKEVVSGGFYLFPLSSKGVIGIIGNSLLISVLMVYFYQWGIKHSSAFAGASALYISPLSTAFFAFLFLEEKISWVLAVGAILISAGVFFTTVLPAFNKIKDF